MEAATEAAMEAAMEAAIPVAICSCRVLSRIFWRQFEALSRVVQLPASTFRGSEGKFEGKRIPGGRRGEEDHWRTVGGPGERTIEDH